MGAGPYQLAELAGHHVQTLVPSSLPCELQPLQFTTERCAAGDRRAGAEKL
jgi:hypothetical protein